MTQPPAGAVLCTGRLYCDLVFSGVEAMPRPGTEVYARGLSVTAGGGAYITAAWLAAQGRPVSLAAERPAGAFGAALAGELEVSGIDLSAMCEPAPGTDPQVTVAMVTGGDRAFLTRRAGAAVPPALQGAALPARWQHLHIGELATLAEHPDLIRAARAAGMTVSLDCSWDAAVLARPELPRLTEGLDILLPNRMEAEALAAHAPLTAYARCVVVKDGPNGAEALCDGRRLHFPAQAVEVVDTIGAGDAFNAGFLHAWLEGRDLSVCLAEGVRVASCAVGRVGGAGALPRLAPEDGARMAAG